MDHLVGLRDGKMRGLVRLTAYKKRLQRATFLGIDLARAIKDVLGSQCFNRSRGREHATRLARRLHARGDVDRITPDIIGELARSDTPAMTGPECRPTRIVKGTGKRDRNRAVAATMSRDV